MTLVLDKPLAYRFELHVNTGGPPIWCAIDFRATSSGNGLEVRIGAESDEATRRWFPVARDALLEAARDESDEFSLVVELLCIHEHPVATTADAVRHYARSLFGEIARRCVEQEAVSERRHPTTG